MLFNDAVSVTWIVYCQMKYWDDYGELKRIMMEVVVAYFKVLSEHSARMPEQTHQNPQSGCLMQQSCFKVCIFCVQKNENSP
jgi:hypothetical protein